MKRSHASVGTYDRNRHSEWNGEGNGERAASLLGYAPRMYVCVYVCVERGERAVERWSDESGGLMESGVTAS